jgi:hypothetical protein
MLRKKIFIIIIGIFLGIILISLIPTSSENPDLYNNTDIIYPHNAASLEGAENILITKIERDAELNGYGLVNYVDLIKIKNMNSNPITSIYIGIPISHTEDLIFFEATGKDEETLLVERESLVMNDFEMIAIYFDSPLLPQQSKEIRFVQTYKDMLIYEKTVGSPQQITFNGYVFPILPYYSKGTIKATYEIPSRSTVISYTEGGVEDPSEDIITYKVNSLDPFLENLVQNPKAIIDIKISNSDLTKTEIDELTREIYISPWGIIKVKEEYLIKNKGAIEIDELQFEIPGPAKEVSVFDDLGEILGVEIDPETNYTHLKYKDLSIDLSENRVTIDPNSKFRFNIQYFLPFEKYFTLNWFQESIKIDVLTSRTEFLGRDHTFKLIIEGCFTLDYVSEPPDAIEHSKNAIILVYEAEYVSPLESRIIQFTFTINFFDIILRPVAFILLIILLSSAFVLLIKSKKVEAGVGVISRELIPVNEIREFCSLYEERNALTFEIRKAEEDVKRKKIIKKKYKNILDKNSKKIEEIEKEIPPFKKIVREVNATFENIIKKLEVLEAERLSVKDSLNLLEARYKRGRLPSKAAYINLSDNFMRRRKKIDGSIEKNIRSLRSYLL